MSVNPLENSNMPGSAPQASWKQMVESFLFDCQLRNLTSKTIKCYLERLNYLDRYHSEQEVLAANVDRKLIQHYILSLRGQVSDETINGRIRVYRRFFNYLVEDKLWQGDNPMKGIRLLRTAKRIKPVVEPSDVQAILRTLNRRTFEGMRNTVLVMLFWDCMLRNKELRSLRIADIDLHGRIIKVFGKGRKERMVPLGIRTVKLLHQYMTMWRAKYPGDCLICMRNGEPLTERHCHKTIQRLGEDVGVKLYPHLIRHSAATWYIRQGGSPVVLQAILGHSSLVVTQRYVHLSVQDAIDSYDKLSPANSIRF